MVLPQWTRKPSAPVLRLDTRPLTGEAGRETRPALSPDGLSVVYSWQQSGDSKPVTFVRDIGSDRKTILPISSPYRWLPDNRRIGFVRRSSGLDALCTISRDGTGEKEILRAREIYDFDWSPNGEWIVYSAKPASKENHAIFLFETSTDKSRQITFPPATAQEATNNSRSHRTDGNWPSGARSTTATATSSLPACPSRGPRGRLLSIRRPATRWPGSVTARRSSHLHSADPTKVFGFILSTH